MTDTRIEKEDIPSIPETSSKENDNQKRYTDFSKMKWYKYIRHLNKNAPIIAIFISILTALVAFLWNFVCFRYKQGYLESYNINIMVLDNTNSLFNFLNGLFIFIYVILISSFIGIKNKKINSIKMFFLKVIAMIFFNIFLFLIIENNIKILFHISTYLYLSALIMIEVAIYFFIKFSILPDFNNKKDKYNNFFKSNYFFTILVFSITLICISFIAYDMGKSLFDEKKDYKFLSNTQVIVYETKDKYYVEDFYVGKELSNEYTQKANKLDSKDLWDNGIVVISDGSENIYIELVNDKNLEIESLIEDNYIFVINTNRQKIIDKNNIQTTRVTFKNAPEIMTLP